jgi:hypothetical protein
VGLFLEHRGRCFRFGRVLVPIVKPDKHASGIAYHQLAALALVARMGGMARIVWDNGGQIGVLREGRAHHLRRQFAERGARQRQGAERFAVDQVGEFRRLIMRTSAGSCASIG